VFEPKKFTRIKIAMLFCFAIFAAVAFTPDAINRIAFAQKESTGSVAQQPIEPICCEEEPTPTPDPTPRVRPHDFESLARIPTPEPDNLYSFVRDRSAAIALGKALFWDMQVGSDGVVSCASCHFHAGADSRSVNQLNPGTIAGDNSFQVGPPNYQLSAADFPFHRLSDPNNRHSSVLFDANDVASSQGVFNGDFRNIVLGSAEDKVFYFLDNIFVADGLSVRRVEPRNTPTVINAVFNFRNFWDGRAQEDFNGVTPFGARDPNAFVMRSDGALVRVSLNKSSLASQAVGPPLSPDEMSGRRRSWPDVGRKMFSLPPLAKQTVAGDDSVLGPYDNPYGNGLAGHITYRGLVEQAFQPEWWQNNTTLDERGFSQIERNFSLFWGIALQMYQATLRSDQTPFDRFMDGDDYAMTDQQFDGLDVFTGPGKCNACHSGAEFTKASFRNVVNEKIERMIMGDGGVAVYDNGFYNIGVRPTQEDLGVGGLDPFGNPLSFTRFFQRFGPFPFIYGEDGAPNGPLDPNERAAVDGAFKTPGLRNVELTAPYFHNGGQFSLRQVVDFYNRGGDFHEANIANLDPDIEYLGLSEYQKNALVAFLRALTDERVRYHRAPFDHPSLQITTGHHNPAQDRGDGTQRAIDLIGDVQAVGAGGLGAPLQNFPAFRRQAVIEPTPEPTPRPCFRSPCPQPL